MCFENSSILVFSFQITLLSDLFADKLKIVGSIDNTKLFFFLSFFPFLPWAHHFVLLSCFLISFSLTFPIDNREWWSSNKTLNNTVVGKFIAFASAFFSKMVLAYPGKYYKLNSSGSYSSPLFAQSVWGCTIHTTISLWFKLKSILLHKVSKNFWNGQNPKVVEFRVPCNHTISVENLTTVKTVNYNEHGVYSPLWVFGISNTKYNCYPPTYS